MIGYGPESNHFVIELTYNYGVTCYECGNDFDGITIKSKEVIHRAKKHKYPFIVENNKHILCSPDGYTFYVLNEAVSKGCDPVTKVGLRISNLENSLSYWVDVLEMQLIERTDKCAVIAYSDNQTKFEMIQSDEPINRASAYGRTAFAIPCEQQSALNDKITAINGTILTPLISLDTPGKATVRVIILADPDGHEICFVDEEGFAKLSEFDPAGDALLEKYIKRDPFQPK